MRKDFDASGQLVSETRYVYDGMRVLQERNGANQVLVTYTRGLDLSGSLEGTGGIGGLLARTDSSGTAYYHHDGSGNVTALVDGQHRLVARYVYEPFGNLIGAGGPLAEANTYRFSDKEYDPKAGIYYYGYRFYEPNLQRWLNPDPLGELGGVNLYGFVGNDPMNSVDLWGLYLTPGHNRLIERAFGPMFVYQPVFGKKPYIPSVLSPTDRALLKKGSRFVDSVQFQSAECSFMHAMTAPNQSAENAFDKMNAFVLQKLERAVELEKNADHAAAMFFLGQGMHPLMDWYSDSHAGFQMWESFNWKNPLTWPSFAVGTAWHAISEVTPVSRSKQQAIGDMLQRYHQEFLRRTVKVPKLNRFQSSAFDSGSQRNLPPVFVFVR